MGKWLGGSQKPFLSCTAVAFLKAIPCRNCLAEGNPSWIWIPWTQLFECDIWPSDSLKKELSICNSVGPREEKNEVESYLNLDQGFKRKKNKNEHWLSGPIWVQSDGPYTLVLWRPQAEPHKAQAHSHIWLLGLDH